MDRGGLEKRNVGENLDALMNLDPRGYGVCRILYAGSREQMGEPLTMRAAEMLCETVKEDDLVYILTGFVLLPHKKPEMDGMVSSMLLARALVMAFGAKPVIICPEDCVKSVVKCACVVGLHIYQDIGTVRELPLSMGVIAFTKNPARAEIEAEWLIKEGLPGAVISVEAPGSNENGVYHNSAGDNVTELEAKTDILWEMLRKKGVLNIAIGDLGNEIGMGAIADHIKKYIPLTAPGECVCGCGGGILAASRADHVITATCSDWGCYGLIAALAYLKRDMEILHREEMEAELMRAASRTGLIDMTGSLIPGIDGFSTRLNTGIVSLMRQCTAYAVRYSHNSDHWFRSVLEKGFFEEGDGPWFK
ncbi:Uncharacterised protein [Lacrimispora sphenoides]|uniref:D-glutamate cyclase-like C-terminal domain-containing protein n=2 Tax=Lacrimispora sphenoides TaxID=29370 RepID=A0ABY1C2T9_9FIRM|nr:protein of unknown function [[Clostridium] sphenoides JCM 1415]SUY49889.1 Uncharacterised protein [Lacrimispora sphenoides]